MLPDYRVKWMALGPGAFKRCVVTGHGGFGTSQASHGIFQTSSETIFLVSLALLGVLVYFSKGGVFFLPKSFSKHGLGMLS